MVRRRFNLDSREETLARDPLREFFVWWKDIKPADVRALAASLAQSSASERALQVLLEHRPLLLVQQLGGGHGRWVIPQQRLGVQYVTDFLVGEKHSGGYEWTAVELESPSAPIFTKRGDPSARLAHAVRQIQDWRAWLKRNQAYAANDRTQNGLGLRDIDPALPGLVLIGRESTTDSRTNELRRQMASDLRIQIHTYDWLLRNARGRARRARAMDRQSRP